LHTKLLLLTPKRGMSELVLRKKPFKKSLNNNYVLELKVCKTKVSTYSSVTLTSPVAMSLTDKQAFSFRVMLYASPEEGHQLQLQLSKPSTEEDLVQYCFEEASIRGIEILH
jgi:hypothetical protein